MLDPYMAVATLVLFAAVIGVVIFGGTTLVHVLDQRRPDRSNDQRLTRLPQESDAIAAREGQQSPRDRAA